jgi:transcriptional regulator with XRE-family HTH domain
MMMKRKGISEQEKQFNVLVGQRICRARKAAGLTAKHLALAAGVSSTQVYWYETGAFRCPPFVLDAFARRLKVSLRDLVPKTRLSNESTDSAGDDGKLF